MRIDRLEELLSRGRLGGPARDGILRGALREAGIDRSRGGWALRVFAGLATVGVGVATFSFVAGPSGLRPKGGGQSRRAPVATVECSGVDARHCSRADMIVFRFDGCADGAQVAAYARPLAGGAPIWFFPLESGGRPTLSRDCGPQVLPQGIPAHELPPDRYQVHVIVTRGPLTRSEILSGTEEGVVASTTSTLDLVP